MILLAQSPPLAFTKTEPTVRLNRPLTHSFIEKALPTNFTQTSSLTQSQGFGKNRATAMAKSKNHTAHNQSYKNHRNGIKRPKKQQFASRKGMDLKFLKNQKHALRGTIQARLKANREAES
ncbi:unnamed protein product [Chondrus crispus]|uniref:60S ribosomal protein L29 n=1 Tax=Chondrus crispus TaxID=2769 RepID=R7Q7E4_CHOCR|nr:unnamed protein product [Chondrus crispus]CDF33753.1 unnamed protein product [Chondrus crispus]|eukprot:XP_005713572.1 unnamed protein product [Chondrus crispus]